jgi:hypothetical protein
MAFWIAGALCVLAGASFLTLGRRTFTGAPAVSGVTLDALATRKALSEA